MCVMHDLCNSGVLCLKFCGESNCFWNWNSGKTARLQLLQNISGLICFQCQTSKCCQFHFLFNILYRPKWEFLLLPLHVCTCFPSSLLCCCKFRGRSLSEIIPPVIAVWCAMLRVLCWGFCTMRMLYYLLALYIASFSYKLYV